MLFNILFYPLILPSCMKLRTFWDCYFITWSLLRSTCNTTYLLESSLALNYLRAPHFVSQQPTEPSDFHSATWVHFRHFGTAQSDLSDLSWCVVFLMLSSELKSRNETNCKIKLNNTTPSYSMPLLIYSLPNLHWAQGHPMMWSTSNGLGISVGVLQWFP